MINLTTAEKALKEVYLGVLSNQLNINANPLLAKIKQTTSDVWGNNIVKLAPCGINGGISSGTETGNLPDAGETPYVRFVSTLKNLYGSLQISDKAIRASMSNAGAFVNLLNSEMENLIKASNFNLGRMIYGDGSGIVATPIEHINSTSTKVDSVRNLVEGMKLQFVDKSTEETINTTLTITKIDRANKIIHFNTTFSGDATERYLIIQGSYNNELTGLGAIFNDSASTIYGVSKSDNLWLTPYSASSIGVISDEIIQTAIDYLEDNFASTVDFISCSSSVKRAYQAYLNTYRRNIDVMELTGGYKALSYNGIPFISDRFVEDDAMYLLNTKEFTLHQLCDWQWLEDNDGTILRQKDGYPVYNATLVKYADLICDKPNGQAKLSGITSGNANPYSSIVSAISEVATDTDSIATSIGAVAVNTEKLSTDYASVNADALSTGEV